MKRRTFIQALLIGAALTTVPAISKAVNNQERYRANTSMPSHGIDDSNGMFYFKPNQEGAIDENDVLVRLGTIDNDVHAPGGKGWERIYNETKDTIVWFPHAHGFWSDRKADCIVQGDLPTWFERI